MIAFHGKQDIKDKYLARVRAHRAADELVQGTGWKDGKGCAVGCTLEAYDHARYPDELGVPVELAFLEDRLFELQTKKDSDAWPERFLAAIEPGADLSRVWSRWAHWMLVDPEHGVVRHAAGWPDAEAAIREVARLWSEGGTPSQFRAAAAAAWAAARAAEAEAEAAWAARAAWAAAWAAVEAAAAWAAAEAAEAWAAARAWAWVRAACDRLISLLQEVKP